MSPLAWSSRAPCSSGGTSPIDGGAGGGAATGARGTRMTQRGEATRARLIEATRSVVREVGYAHASTRAIAQAAGVAEGTIYRHFPDKASLFFATVLESNAPIVAWVTTLPARAGEGTVEENLTDAAVAARRPAGPDPAARAGDRRRSRARGAAPAGDGGRGLLAAARARRRPWPPTSPPSSGWGASARTSTRERPPTVLLGMLFALGTMPAIGDEGLSPDRVASAVRLMVRGIQPIAARALTADDRRRSRHRPTSGEPARRSRSPRPGRP